MNNTINTPMAVAATKTLVDEISKKCNSYLMGIIVASSEYGVDKISADKLKEHILQALDFEVERFECTINRFAEFEKVDEVR